MDILPQCRGIQGAAQLGSRVRYRSFGHLAKPSTCSMAYNEQSILDSRQCLLWNPEICLVLFVKLLYIIQKKQQFQAGSLWKKSSVPYNSYCVYDVFQYRRLAIISITIIALLKLLKGRIFQELFWSELILDSDWLVFVIIDSNQSGDSLPFGQNNPLENRCPKGHCKTIIV